MTDRLSDRGGAYRHLLGVLEGLRVRGHVVHVATGQVGAELRGPRQRKSRGGLRLVVADDDGESQVPAETRPVEGDSSWAETAVVVPGLEARSDSVEDEGATSTGVMLAALDDLLSRTNPDVVHVHTVMRPSVLAWAADKGAIVTVQDHRVFCPGQGKLTANGHRCDTSMSGELCSACFEDAAYFQSIMALTEARLGSVRRMRRAIVLSEYMARELRGVSVPPERLEVIPPFAHGLQVDAEADEGGPCILFVGRLVAAKGVWAAVEAWKKSGLGLPLVFAGTGPLRDRLEADGFEVCGWLDRLKLSRLFRRASLLVLPSLWQEPFGIVGLEALAFGVPVAAWDSGGVGEWHPGPGLVSWGDTTALADAMRRLVGSRAEARPGFDEQASMGRLLALYREVASGPRQA